MGGGAASTPSSGGLLGAARGLKKQRKYIIKFPISPDTYKPERENMLQFGEILPAVAVAAAAPPHCFVAADRWRMTCCWDVPCPSGRRSRRRRRCNCQRGLQILATAELLLMMLPPVAAAAAARCHGGLQSGLLLLTSCPVFRRWERSMHSDYVCLERRRRARKRLRREGLARKRRRSSKKCFGISSLFPMTFHLHLPGREGGKRGVYSWPCAHPKSGRGEGKFPRRVREEEERVQHIRCFPTFPAPPARKRHKHRPQGRHPTHPPSPHSCRAVSSHLI